MAERLPVGAARSSKSSPLSSSSPTAQSDVSSVATEQICASISFHEPDSMGSNCLVISNGSSTNGNHSIHARVGQSETIIRNKNKTDAETYQGMEWVEQDEPGVYITLVSFPGGVKDLKRVRFRYVIPNFNSFCARCFLLKLRRIFLPKLNLVFSLFYSS